MEAPLQSSTAGNGMSHSYSMLIECNGNCMDNSFSIVCTLICEQSNPKMMMLAGLESICRRQDLIRFAI